MSIILAVFLSTVFRAAKKIGVNIRAKFERPIFVLPQYKNPKINITNITKNKNPCLTKAKQDKLYQRFLLKGY
jgi:hypothetical protein